MTLTIGKLAGLAGVGVETIRFYERRGLVSQPPRADAGYRVYDRESVARVKFIRRAQALGFSLREIHDLLGLHGHSAHACATVKRQAAEKIRSIESKIEDLQAMRDGLRRLVAACARRRALEVCPVLTALGGD